MKYFWKVKKFKLTKKVQKTINNIEFSSVQHVIKEVNYREKLQCHKKSWQKKIEDLFSVQNNWKGIKINTQKSHKVSWKRSQNHQKIWGNLKSLDSCAVFPATSLDDENLKIFGKIFIGWKQIFIIFFFCCVRFEWVAREFLRNELKT